jgi:hypothetical protein
MKKNLLLTLSFLLIGSLVFAQKTNVTFVPKTINKKQSTREITPFWTDDFSDANTWGTSNNVGNSDNWTIGVAGPSGDYKIDPINSTSHDNGFALFDSDKLCSGKQNAYLTTKNAIDCSSHSNIVLSFESFYRKYKDSIFVEVSNNGTDWTSFRIHEEYEANETDPSNPTTEKFLISSIADGQSTVYIRFHFKSKSTGCDYSWQVDDVQLSELPTTDLSVNSKRHIE